MTTETGAQQPAGSDNTVDPLGGSYFVEALIDQMEAQAYDYFRKIDELGGMVAAVKDGYPQREMGTARTSRP